MASKIRVLTDDTINKIAAGEVIENPASVVKELVENAIDAGSTEITIEINGGGRQLIRISDNGCGMNGDDALLCLERHATSKIRSVDDLEGVMTMGFRGEAIPSIASISKFTLLTCPQPTESHPDPKGTLIIIDGGKILTVAAAVRAPGTTMEVKNLFFNVPVRRKFMKSPAVDSNEIVKMVTLIALGNPMLKFQLIIDGRNELNTSLPKSKDFQESLKSRMHDILGREFVENCRYFEHSTEVFSIKGFVGTPLYNRHNRTGQWLFINGRGVVSPLIANSVKDGYGTCLPTGRYPVFLLHFNVSGEFVDVNVHPQKREVRLRQEQYFREQIAKGIQDCIHQNPSTSDPFSEPFVPTISPVFADAIRSPIPFEEPPQWRFSAPEPTKFVPPPRVVLPNTPPIEFRRTPAPEDPPATQQQQLRFETTSSSKDSAPTPAPRIVATIPGYVLVENISVSTISIVDQKAAHCRILYEKFSEALEGSPAVLQPLLVPHSIELLPNEAAQLRKMLPHLNAMGLQVREFGPRTFIVDAVPEILSHENLDTLILDVLESGLDVDQRVGEQAKRLSIAMNRRAVSAKKRLSTVEAQSLVEQLHQCENSKVCPQGRLISAPLSPEEIAKFFQQTTAISS
jgi:DNA mismatch repair protein MutL